MTKKTCLDDFTEEAEMSAKIEMLHKALEDKDWIIEKTDAVLKALNEELKKTNDELKDKKVSLEIEVREKIQELEVLNKVLDKKLNDRKMTEKSFRNIIENNADAILVINTSGIIHFVNPAAEKLFNKKAEKLIGNDFGFPVLAGDTTEIDIFSGGNKTVVAEMRIVESEWEDEKVYLASLRDITEHKETENLIKESRRKFQELYDEAPVGYHELDLKGTIVQVNKTEANMLEYTIQEMFGKSLLDFIDPEGAEVEKEFLQKIHKQLPNTEVERTFITRSGKKIFCSVLNKLVFDENIQLTGIRSIIQDISERKRAEEREQLAREVLEHLNRPESALDTIRDILQLVKDISGIEAVGIRLRDGDDFPYYETNGFPDHFVEMERYLCARDEKGEIVRDTNGNPVLECMCGNVLRGRTKPKFPFFTKGGSFWSSCTTDLLASTTEKERQARTRNRCNGEGYESVALIPLRVGKDTIGLLQLNDHRKNQFTLEMIRFFEGLGASIGIALSRQQAEKKIFEYSKSLESMVEDRTREVSIALSDAEQARDRIDGILKSVGEGLLVTDIYNHIVLMNRASENMLDVRLSDVINRTIEFAVDDKTLLNRLQTTLAKDVDDKFDFELLIKGSDKPMFMQARTSVIKDKTGTKTGVTISFHDVTLEREVDRMKTEFISTAAHELRTPLTSIRGFSEILLTRDNIELKDQKKYLNYINNQSIRLANIINDLLDISRIESGKGYVLNKEEANINDILSNTTGFFRDSSKKHTFEVFIPDKPICIKVDEEKLEQVMKNILSNSIKYSPSGGLIQVSGEVSDNCYLVTVKDQGPGMTAEQIEKIFDKFYRADATNTAIEGTGLGMSIVKNIVESHNGKVWVESKLGEGTTVKFTVSF